MNRIGFGTDIHRLVSGRPLVIGGIEIESDFGADGHSDADVLMHAITDAILGALSLGDIGTYFPNTEERWRNAESAIFLKYAAALVKEHRFEIGNVDSVVTLEKPKLRPYIDRICESLAAALDVETDCVNVKAKTKEGLGATGRGEAIRAEAVVMLHRLSK